VGTDHGEVEELLDGLDRRTRGERDTGSVQKNFAEEAGKVLAGGEHDGTDLNTEEADGELRTVSGPY
jgi:hypothetical protein